MALPVPVLFLAKRELVRVPFLGRFIASMGMVFVDRADRRRTTRTVAAMRGNRAVSHPARRLPPTAPCGAERDPRR
jgi:1-acyl-sn-glycerol-3-phosphate acyltransferase